jgi:hypothetical protein
VLWLTRRQFTRQPCPALAYRVEGVLAAVLLGRRDEHKQPAIIHGMTPWDWGTHTAPNPLRLSHTNPDREFPGAASAAYH